VHLRLSKTANTKHIYIMVQFSLFSLILGSMILIGCDPGVGKSTLSLQVISECLSPMNATRLGLFLGGGESVYQLLNSSPFCLMDVILHVLLTNLVQLKISASIAESCDVGGAASLLYISGEEVSITPSSFLLIPLSRIMTV